MDSNQPKFSYKENDIKHIAQVMAQNCTHMTIHFKHILHLWWPSEPHAWFLYAITFPFNLMPKAVHFKCPVSNVIIFVPCFLCFIFHSLSLF